MFHYLVKFNFVKSHSITVKKYKHHFRVSLTIAGAKKHIKTILIPKTLMDDGKKKDMKLKERKHQLFNRCIASIADIINNGLNLKRYEHRNNCQYTKSKFETNANEHTLKVLKDQKFSLWRNIKAHHTENGRKINTRASLEAINLRLSKF